MATKKTISATSAKTAEVVVENNTTVKPAEVVTEANEVLTDDTFVPCVSMIKNGELIYISRRTGDKVVWKNFGEVCEVEMRELRNMRNTDRMFFSENWITIPDSFELKNDVLKKLHVEQFYKNDIDPYDMGAIIAFDVNELTRKIAEMPVSIKETFMRFAKESVENGTLDSITKIRAIEKALNCELL